MTTVASYGKAASNERGFILLAVVVAITLVAAIAFAVGTQGASQVNVTNGEVQRDRLRYVAEAGLAHAKWHLRQNTSCNGYTDIPATGFGAESYTASISPNADSPVTITATGKSRHGFEHRLIAGSFPSYQSPKTVFLQLGKTSGKDTFIDNLDASSNYGGANYLQVTSSAKWLQRPVIQFDLTSIPSTVNIVSAKLQLKHLNVQNPGVVSIHRMTRDWAEGKQAGGGSFDAATWLTYDGEETWTRAGGDFDPQPVAGQLVTEATKNLWASWEIGPLVAGWLTNKVPNYGLLMQGDGLVDQIKFASQDTSDPADAPRLVVTYACECGKICTGGSGGGKNILLVVGDPANLTPEQADKKALMESWGHYVVLIATNATQAEFDATAAVVDVVYIPELGSGPMGELDTKADGLTTGVITEEARTALLLGSWAIWPFVDGDTINITDNTHYITETLPTGYVQISTAVQSMWVLQGTLAPDLHVLGELSGTEPGLAYLENGERLNDGNPAPARRVKLPWGSFDFDVTLLTDEARTIMKRAIEWGGTTPPLPVCDGNFAADRKVGQLDTTSYGGIIAIAYLPEGVPIGGAPLPASGGWALRDSVNANKVLFVDAAGTLLDQMTLSTGNLISNFSYVDSGLHAGKLAILDSGTNELLLADLDGAVTTIWSLAFAGSRDVAFISTGSYAEHFILSSELQSEFIDESGLHVGTVAYPPGIDSVKSIVDIPGEDLIAAGNNTDKTIYIMELAGALPSLNATVVNQFDFLQFGVTSATKGVGFDPVACQYALPEPGELRVILVDDNGGIGGGGGPAKFGFETIFGSTQASVRRMQIATQVTLPTDGTIASITGYVGGRDRNVRYAIYSDVAGEPDTLIAESQNILTQTSMSWVTADVPPTALTAGTYWLALSFDDNLQQYVYEAGGQTRYSNHRATQNGFTSTWGPTTASYSRNISIYATYNP